MENGTVSASLLAVAFDEMLKRFLDKLQCRAAPAARVSNIKEQRVGDILLRAFLGMSRRRLQ